MASRWEEESLGSRVVTITTGGVPGGMYDFEVPVFVLRRWVRSQRRARKARQGGA